MRKKLVILTTHFGTNFSGGSTATCEIFSRIEGNFAETIVVGNQLGATNFDSIKFLRFNSWWHACKILKNMEKSNTVFYGDFYNAILYVWLKIPFYFTYHDNWPELGKTSALNRLKSLYYTSIYKKIFKNAISVFAVSKFKFKFLKKYNKQVLLVRNGFNRYDGLAKGDSQFRVLMVGNIENRKYKLALPLFRLLEKERPDNMTIDIYGNTKNHRLAKKISRFSFVNLKGFYSSVPYNHYSLLLHTSTMENLSIVFCEAIYHGLPILGFDVGGAREIALINNKSSLITPYHIDNMHKEVHKMLADPSRMLSEAPDLEEYSWKRASLKYLNEIV